MKLRWVVVLVAVAGCSSSESSSNFFSDLRSTECDLFVRCGLMPDTAACDASLHLDSFEILTLQADITKGTAKFDSSAASSCLDAIADVGCNAVALESAFDGCNEVITGTVADGGSCNDSGECQNAGTCTFTNCDPDTMCCVGTCSVEPTVAIGQSCVNAHCMTGAYCPPSTSLCTAVVTTEGEPCDSSDACAPPLACFIATGSTGTCAIPAITGGSCAQAPCADIRDYCSQDTAMACTRDAAVGEACGGAAQTRCQGDATCLSSMCVANGTDNSPCQTANAGNCLDGLMCTNNVCVLPPAGMACP